jgi:hypothetical protein
MEIAAFSGNPRWPTAAKLMLESFCAEREHSLSHGAQDLCRALLLAQGGALMGELRSGRQPYRFSAQEAEANPQLAAKLVPSTIDKAVRARIKSRVLRG